MSGAATTPGFGLQYVFGNKMKGAEEDCGDKGISFMPIPSDSLGGWHNEQKERLGAALARRTGQEDGKAILHKAGGTPPDEQCGHTDRFRSRTTDSDC